MAGFTAPKLIWLAEYEPDIFARIKTVLLPKDWLRLRLSGDKASDMSDSAGTLWLDVGKRCWNPDAIAACGLTETAMPALFEGTDLTGRLRQDVADELGLPPAMIAAGAGDNAAGAVGLGAVNDGDAFLSLGTSGVVFVSDSAPLAAPEQTVHTFCHAVPNIWHRMGVVLSAASAVDWAADRLVLAKRST
jgi:xylulokinase